MEEKSGIYDVIVIGGGQSALAVAYYLKRTGLNYLLLDQETAPGGAWQYTWRSLSLFSPAQWSSLPGVIMPGGQDYYPNRQETITYLQQYEDRYKFPVMRPVKVSGVSREDGVFKLDTTRGVFRTRVVVSATGSYAHPYIPDITGMDGYKGHIIHSADYRQPEDFSGKRTAIVGEGNSGAQILAELSGVTDTLWITRNPPEFLPDHIDGRYLFDAATQVYEARKQGKDFRPPSLGHIVTVPAVREARDRHVYDAYLPAFDHFYNNGIAWNNGRGELVDAVIFCTGFRPALEHLRPLGITQPDGRIQTRETKATEIDGLWLVGYGSWTGFASATLIGVGRSAKRTADELTAFLKLPV